MATISATALTTVAEVKDALSITVSTYDGTIARVINAASDWFVRQTGRRFDRGTVTETFTGHGFDKVLLSRFPLVSITSISFKGSALSASDYAIYDANAGIIQKVNGVWLDTSLESFDLRPSPVPGTGPKDYSAVYVGGYYLPASGSRDLPYDIEESIIEMSASKYRALGRDQSVASESVLSYSVSFKDSDVSDFVRQTVNAYKVFV